MKQCTPNISKSSFMAGCQCPKLFWTRIHDREAMPPINERQQAVFDQGHEVGMLARALFPEGTAVECDPGNYGAVLSATTDLLGQGKPIFEAGFSSDGGFVRVDILNPTGRDTWEIIEVKMSTKVKEEHIPDVAFQKYVCEAAGVIVERCCLMHVNKEYVRRGDLELEEFFETEDITSQVEAALEDVLDEFTALQDVAREDECPEVCIGAHCNAPHECPLKDRCWSFLPPYPVTDLYYAKKKGFALLAAGIQKIQDIPEITKLNQKQEIQRASASTGAPHFDADAIAEFLSGLQHPLSFLDFETFRSPIPPFDGTRPYQQLPFQYSLHVVESEGEKPGHLGFLAEDASDRRNEFLSSLKDDLPEMGSIVVYNASFELGRLRECSDFNPEYREWLEDLEPRIVDLLDPFRGFAYYHPDQHGSASIKAVLPVLTGAGYEHLTIQDGDTASLEFLKSCQLETSDRERESVRSSLEEYCKLDTLGMVQIITALGKLADTSLQPATPH